MILFFRVLALVWVCLFPAWCFGEPRLFAPVTLKPGAVNELYAWDTAGFPAFQVKVLRPNGKVVATATSFAWSSGTGATSSDGAPLRVSVALLAFDVLTSPGPVRVLMLSPSGRLLLEQPSEITPRTLPVEVIPLDKAMTDLRTIPDLRKDKEAQQIWAVYMRFHPQALWTEGRYSLPVEGVASTASFGDIRKFAYSDGTSETDYHHGTDFAAPVGTKVAAPATGLVALAAQRELTGGTLVIEHAPGLYSVYFHLSRLLVTVGDRVERGQTIALSGKTGLVTGPHLHWEMRCDGVPVDALDAVIDGVLDKDRTSELISSIERKRG